MGHVTTPNVSELMERCDPGCACRTRRSRRSVPRGGLKGRSHQARPTQHRSGGGAAAERWSPPILNQHCERATRLESERASREEGGRSAHSPLLVRGQRHGENGAGPGRDNHNTDQRHLPENRETDIGQTRSLVGRTDKNGGGESLGHEMEY